MKRVPILKQLAEVAIVMAIAGVIAWFVIACVSENAGIATSPVAADAAVDAGAQ